MSRATLGWVVAALSVFAAVIWIRCVVSAKDELEQARAAEHAGDVQLALAHYQYALRWYSPGASAPVAAADALDRIATAAEAAQDRALALATLRRLRGGVLATRSLFSPFGDRLPQLNARLATLTADEQLAGGDDETLRGRDRPTLVADHLALLKLDPSPNPWLALLVVLGFFGWVGGAALFIARGLDREARLQVGPALRWGGVTAVCFAGWIVGLIYA